MICVLHGRYQGPSHGGAHPIVQISPDVKVGCQDGVARGLLGRLPD